MVEVTENELSVCNTNFNNCWSHFQRYFINYVINSNIWGKVTSYHEKIKLHHTKAVSNTTKVIQEKKWIGNIKLFMPEKNSCEVNETYLSDK